mmetsp:Transcript_16961/g.47350  ORF Transcript_16961/g.47350 Transcript_16961/m.47350 type:complete len:267 (-) Transcript_16961:1102-1902(-)
MRPARGEDPVIPQAIPLQCGRCLSKTVQSFSWIRTGLGARMCARMLADGCQGYAHLLLPVGPTSACLQWALSFQLRVAGAGRPHPLPLLVVKLEEGLSLVVPVDVDVLVAVAVVLAGINEATVLWVAGRQVQGPPHLVSVPVPLVFVTGPVAGNPLELPPVLYALHREQWRLGEVDGGLGKQALVLVGCVKGRHAGWLKARGDVHLPVHELHALHKVAVLQAPGMVEEEPRVRERHHPDVACVCPAQSPGLGTDSLRHHIRMQVHR